MHPFGDRHEAVALDLEDPDPTATFVISCRYLQRRQYATEREVLDLLKDSDNRTYEQRLLMYEIDQEINKKWPISTRFILFLKELPFMLPLDHPDDIAVLGNEREFYIPLQNYTCTNIIKPLKDVFTRPGHIKIEQFVMETGPKDEYYINFTASLEQKNFLLTSK